LKVKNERVPRVREKREERERVREGPISRLDADPFSVPFPSITPSPSFHQYRCSRVRGQYELRRVRALPHSYACSCVC